MLKYIDIPPVWALLTAIICWLLAKYIPIFNIQIPIIAYVMSAAIGFGLATWSAVWFLRKKTTIEPRHVPTTLIVEGPFRINRNPIYTGMVLVRLAFAFWLGDLIAILPVLMFPLLITKRFIKGEEAQLRESFGAAADDYIGKTRRW